MAWALKSLPPWYLCVGLFAYGFVLRDALLSRLDRFYVDNVGIAAVAAAALIFILWAAKNYRLLRANRLASICFVASAAAALAGLVSVDPAFPAKRIHVAEYFLLAGLVFVAFKAEGNVALRGLVALIVTAMLGGIDELIQGVLDARTFGLADMLTNALGAIAGVSAVVGWRLLKGGGEDVKRFGAAGMAPPLALAAGYFMTLMAIYPFRGLAFPWWVLLPTAGGLTLAAKYGGNGLASETVARFTVAVGVIALTAMGGLAYVKVIGISFL